MESTPSTSTSIKKPRSNKRLLIFLFITIIGFVLVVSYWLFLKTTGSDTGGEKSPGPPPAGTQGVSPVGTQGLTDYKPEARGGVIRFNPDGGKYTNRVQVQISVKEPLKSKRGEVIDSYIFYTLDGTEPTRTNGNKYTRGSSISLSDKSEFTLKARLISKVGKYESPVYTRTYSLQPPVQTSPLQGSPTQPDTRKTLPQNQNNLTDFGTLDISTREEILQKTKLIVVEVDGITEIKKNSDLKFLLSIAKTGKANILNISGFEVQPPEKLAEIISQLDHEIQDSTFSPPTIKGKPVDVKTWVGFTKIAWLEEKVMIER